ncbi:uncharacterized protein FTJAE_14171 [Fusarium tjaetaba]|uniref:BTB domain-containing protein n=1 Tax=Fusarium tjaetaba TaxID=1567544 RepID=A0A8H5QB65_9HYPO|nr:uncharacterized protein FTJAE_14171 [Fusarium tjaetaba]KAF5611564.1 hypothetical protein FTJAE_14171 [Fusarium tjaetaba]
MANAADSQIVEIVPDGDVILVVGPDKAKLRVKSMFLMVASKPFSVMLGPYWKEGHDMRCHDGPFELSLPEDNATAMEIICSVIHLQNGRIPRTIPAGDVLAIAIAGDKYDCLNALQFASKAWILKPKGKPPKDLMLLTAAAYIFGDAEAFNRATTALVLGCHDSYLALSDSELESIIPWSLFSMLEEQRGAARLKAADILPCIHEQTESRESLAGESPKYLHLDGAGKSKEDGRPAPNEPKRSV